ncbi:MAG: MBL fold metallo-hydrolase [Phycisphaerales bacterium]
MDVATLRRRDLFRWAGAAGLALMPGAGAIASAPRGDAPKRPEPAKFARFKVGSIDGVILSDGAAAIAPIQPTMAPTASAEELQKALDFAFHPRDHATLEFNAAVLTIGPDVVLVDTGTGAPEAPLGALRANLAAAGLRPEDVTAVVITHAHTDHIGGLVLPDGSLAFPKAKVLISKTEHDFWTSSPSLSASRLPEESKKEMTAAIQKGLAAVKSKLEFIAPGAKTFPGVEILDTNGHTPGHLSLMISNGADQLCLLADVAHNHVVMFANPAWTIAFDTDPALAAAARAKVFDRLAADRTRVLAYHLPWPGLGHIRRHGAGYEWIMQPWGDA